MKIQINDALSININAREIDFKETDFKKYQNELMEICSGFFIGFEIDDIKRVDKFIEESKCEVFIFNQGENDFSIFESDLIIPFLLNNKINFSIKDGE